MLFHAIAFSVLAPLSAVGPTTITTNPATPAPGEAFTITVRGSWSNGCVPRFQSFTPSGTTLQIDAVSNLSCGACTTAVTPYSFTTPPVISNTAGVFTIEYYVTECNTPRTLQGSIPLPISSTCQFDHSLTASAPAVRVGTPFVLSWCDPSVIPSPDQGVGVSFYRIVASRNANGPFVPIGDVTGTTSVGINFDAEDVGPAYFFVEAHECNETIAGCTGDIVVRSNILRVDVALATGCLPDATTLCLNKSRFQVRAQWQTPDGGSGAGEAVSLTNDSGYFWFFGPDNVEVVVKALNACTQPIPNYWFFAAGLTNVGVDLTVTDTKTGTVKTYHNPLNQPFQAIQDTSAFATCP